MDSEYVEKNRKDIKEKFTQPKGGWQEALSSWADKMGFNGTINKAKAEPSPSPSPMGDAIKKRLGQ